MKLSHRMFNSFILAIVIVVIITAITAGAIFKRTLNKYVEAQREIEFDKIVKDISFLHHESQHLNLEILSGYAKNKSLNIKVVDFINGREIEFKAIKDEDTKNSKLVTKTYDLVNPDDEKVGVIEISYMQDIFLFNKSLSDLYNNTLTYYSVILILSILIGIVFVYGFTKSITNPITEINEATKKITKGDYETVKDIYNIYEIDELANNLNYLSKTLKVQEDLRHEYAQDIAHELRTPLTNLLLHLEGLRDQIIEPDEATINLLLSEVSRLNTMVDNLQSSFIDSNKNLELKLEDVEIVDLIDKLVLAFEPLAKEKNIDLMKSLDSFTIRTDRDKLTQILANLLSNAIKAVNEGGHIEVTSREFANRYVISVKDDGVGISREDQAHIFDRFFRVDSDRNRTKGGHGLGLAIASTFVDLLDGNISVNSAPGKGSEFIIAFEKPNKKEKD